MLPSECGSLAGSKVCCDLHKGISTGALAPQPHEILPEVVVEVIRGCRVGNEDGQASALEVSTLQLVKPEGKAILPTKRCEIRNKCLPRRTGLRIRSGL